jgi:hypothetical protein
MPRIQEDVTDLAAKSVYQERKEGRSFPKIAIRENL